MNPEIWVSSVNNTNVTEAAHTLANQEGNTSRNKANQT